MKQKRRKPSLHSFTAACLLLSIFLGSSVFVLAAPVSKGRAAEITVSGEGDNGERPFLRLNGEQVLSGRTFFSYSTLETPQNASADINLPGLGRISMSPGTMLTLGFSEAGITGKLHAGKIRVFSAKGTSVDIETPDDRINNDPSVAGNFTLDISSGTSDSVSESGAIFSRNGLPATRAQTTGGESILIPVAIYAGIVGAAFIAVLVNRNGNDKAADVVISPVR